jgi:hypothetical protein
VLLADVPDNLVLEEPHAKDKNTENYYKCHHVIEYILFALGIVHTVKFSSPSCQFSEY